MIVEKQESIETGLEIAIIGMAGRFPGAQGIEALWQSLKAGAEAVRFLTEEELQSHGIEESVFHNSHYVKGVISLESRENFDAQFFDYTPTEARIMNPQTRILHECVWEALEDAGYNPDTYNGLIGLFVGASTSFDWEVLSRLGGNRELLGGYLENMLSNRDFIATRVSYCLNLKGPAVSIQTACSTSLVAVDYACRSLLTGQCDMAIAGGIRIFSTEPTGYMYQEGMILSRDGHCRPFDADGSGIISGEGVGLVVLKVLEDARQHGDHIEGVIKGTAVNNDGRRKIGYPALSVQGQAEVIKTALHMGDVSPETILYVEAHGTATPMGDPMEFEALTTAFNTTKRNYCGVGSIKGNLGHLDSAAGIAGLIKGVLVLKHKMIPPLVNFKYPNKAIDVENSPFYFNSELMELKVNDYPARAGVSSFGMGGTNVHVILEEAPLHGRELVENKGENDSINSRVILLSARTASSLKTYKGKLAQFLEHKRELDIRDIAFTLYQGRKFFEYRCAVLCHDTDELRKALKDDGIIREVKGKEWLGVIFVLPGSWDLYINCGDDLWEHEPVFREGVESCFNILDSLLQVNMKEILYKKKHLSGGGEAGFEPYTAYLVFALEYGMIRLLMEWGIKPSAIIGKGMGEYLIGCIEGTITLEEGLNRIVKENLGIQHPGKIVGLPEGREGICILLGPGNDNDKESTELKKELGIWESWEVIHAFEGRDTRKDGRDYLLEKIGEIWTYGIGVAWDKVYRNERAFRVSLPTYAFEGKRYWLDNVDISGLEKGNFRVKKGEWEGLKGKEWKSETNDREGIIGRIWEEVLGYENIGRDDDFFKLKGDSLKAIVTISKINKRLGVEIGIGEFFKHGTIRSLSNYLGGVKRIGHELIPLCEEKEYYTLSPGQTRIYFLHQMTENSTVYNTPQVFFLDGKWEIEKLQWIFEELIERHESLRTGFELINGSPVQRIHRAVEFRVVEGEPLLGVPFDLSKPPLLRVFYIGGGDKKGKPCFYMDMHHIITDGVSQEILKREFMVLARGENLGEAGLQYRDYSEWFNYGVGKEWVAEQESFWLEALSGELPILNLPYDFQRSGIQSFEGKRVDFEWSNELSSRIGELAREKGLTVFMVLLGVYTILLSKLSGQEDIIIGTPVGARRREELQGIVGMMVNTLALRNFPIGELNSDAFLEKLKERMLNAFENQEYPFEMLVEKLQINRNSGRNPIFDVMFSMMNEVDSQGEDLWGGKTTDLEKRGTEDWNRNKGVHFASPSKFDLMLTAMEMKDGLHFSFNYSSELFREETINGFMEFFEKIARVITTERSVKLGDLEIISEEEKHQILYTFNDTYREYPGEKTIDELFRDEAERNGERIGVVGLSLMGMRGGVNNGDVVQLTFGELEKRGQVFGEILKKKGVMEGDIVGIEIERSIEMLIGLIGIVKVGGVYLPIDPSFPSERIDYMLKDSGAKILVDMSFFEEEKKRRGEEGVFLTSTGTPLRITGAPGVYVMYTSGTTGKPKGVMVGDKSVIRLVKNTNFVEFKETDRVMPTGAISFDASTFEIWGPLLNGAGIYLASTDKLLDTESLGKLIRRECITVMWMTSGWFNQVCSINPWLFGSLRVLLVGGDVLPSKTIGKLRETFGDLEIINGYGPTENTTFSTTYSIKEIGNENIPIGKPIANSLAFIVDKYLKLVPVGVCGELLVGGDGLAMGYLNNPELTADKFVCFDLQGLFLKKTPLHLAKTFDNINLIKNSCGGAGGDSYKKSPLPVEVNNNTILVYKTGDQARWLGDGNIEFLGRLDSQVKIRGYRIELSEVERVLMGFPAVKEGVVLGVGENEGKGLCAYVVVSDWEGEKIGDSSLVEKLRDYLTERLPGYMVPSWIVSVEGIPLTSNGKVDRRRLPLPGVEEVGEILRPETFIEKKLAEIWSEILSLRIESVGVNRSFFELGGNSLKAAVLIARISKELEVKVGVSEIFKTSDIRGLARLISEGKRVHHVGVEPTEKKEYYAVSPSQQRFYMIQQITPGSIGYNLPQVIPMGRDVDRERIEGTIKRLIEGHESLRTGFITIDEQPVQRVYEAVEFKMEYAEGEDAFKDFVRPFDLSKAPLLRVRLVKSDKGGKEGYYLLYDMHHIISDGTSVMVLSEDFLKLYGGEELPPMRVQYRDFTNWLEEVMRTREGEVNRYESFWLKQLSGDLPVLDLATDFPRAKEPDYRGDMLTFGLDKGLSEGIKDLGKETGTTLYMILLAAMNTLMYRYTGQEDIIIGSPTAGRNHADLQRVIGLMLGTLLMRNFPKGEKTFGEFLEEVKQRTLEAYEYQDYPYEKILEKVDYKDLPGRNPVCDIALNVLNMFSKLPTGPSEEREHEGYFGLESKLDFSLYVLETDKGIVFNLEYRTGLFLRETMLRMLTHLKNILREAVNNRFVFLGDIDFLDEKEKIELFGDNLPVYGLSHPQKRIYYTEKRYPGTPANWITFLVRYNEILDKDKLEQAINLILQRHEALRFRIVEAGYLYEPFQYLRSYEWYKLEVKDFSHLGENGEGVFREWSNASVRESISFLGSNLYYFAFIKFKQGKSGFYMKLHHLIADGATIFLLTSAINSVYRALCSGQSPDEMVGESYIRYLNDEKVYLKSPRALSDREFWHKTLLPLPEGPVLTDGKIFSTQRSSSGIEAISETLALPGELRSRIHEFCNTNKTSIYKLLLAAFSIFIYRVTGNNDIVIGSAGHNRTKQYRGTVGMFVSTFPLRVRVNHGLSFSEFLRKAGEEASDIIKNHQGYPFDKLALELRSLTGIDPSSLLNINLIGHSDLEESDYRLEYFFPGYEPTPLNIHINVHNRDIIGILELDWVYRTAYYSSVEIRRMNECLITILEDALMNPEKRVSEIDLVSMEEKEGLLEHLNRMEGEPIERVPIHVKIREQGEKHADRVVLMGSTCLSDKTSISENLQLSYRELNDRVENLARALYEKGVLQEDIIALKMERSVEMIVGILGILTVGGAYLPMDLGYPADRIDYMLKDSGAKLLVDLSFFEEFKLGDRQEIEKGDEKGDRQKNKEWSVNRDGEMAYIIYTSGTTGRPKGVAVTHGNLVGYLEAFDRQFDLNEKDIVVQQASYTFDAFVEEMYPVLLKGGKLAIPRKEEVVDIERLAEFIERIQVTMITCSPAMLGILNERLSGDSCRIRIFISGGDVLKKEQIDNLLKIGKVYNTYGPTEATVCATYYECTGKETEGIPIGKSILGYGVIILDTCFQPVPVGIKGELCIIGRGVTRGYLNNPELTGDKFIAFDLQGLFLKKPPLHLAKTYDNFIHSDLTPHLVRTSDNDTIIKNSCGGEGGDSYKKSLQWARGINNPIYRTGDIARILEDGNIEFLGRIDSQVKIRGFRVDKGEIENRLIGHPMIKEGVVLDQENENGEKFLCAYFVTLKEAQLSVGEVKSYLLGFLPEFMIPAYIMQVEYIPRTSGGKPDRRLLPVPEGGMGGEFTAPRERIEEELSLIWGEVLGIDTRKKKIGIDDNFFDLGGHSLKATVLASRIHKGLGVKISLGDIFKNQTIRGLAECIKNVKKTLFTELERVEEREYYDLSYNQKRLWITNQKEPESAFYNLSTSVTLEGENREEMVKEVIKVLIERHESARTSFKLLGESPVQFVKKMVDVPLRVVDLSHLSGPEMEQESARVMYEAMSAPFDLSKPPLFRAVLIKLDANEWELVFTMHHIISDGWSIGVLTRDFFGFYNALSDGKKFNIDELAIQYKDFVLWQNERLQEKEFKESSLSYWKEKLGNGAVRLALPMDFVGGNENRESAGYRFTIHGETYNKMKKLAKEHNTGIFTVTLALLGITMSKLSGQQDFLMGMVGAGRENLLLHPIVGFFVNTLVVRPRIDYTRCFGDILDEFGKDHLELLKYQDYPLELVCDDLKMGYPDIRLMFNMVNIFNTEVGEDIEDFSGLHMERVQDVKFDMALYGVPYRNGLRFHCMYRKGCFKKETIEYMMGQYIKISEHSVWNPDTPINTFLFEKKKKRLVLE